MLEQAISYYSRRAITLTEVEREFIKANNNSAEGKPSYVETLDLNEEDTVFYFIMNKKNKRAGYFVSSRFKGKIKIDIYILPKFRKLGFAKACLQMYFRSFQKPFQEQFIVNVGTENRLKFYQSVYQELDCKIEHNQEKSFLIITPNQA